MLPTASPLMIWLANSTMSSLHPHPHRWTGTGDPGRQPRPAIPVTSTGAPYPPGTSVVDQLEPAVAHHQPGQPLDHVAVLVVLDGTGDPGIGRHGVQGVPDGLPGQFLTGIQHVAD